VDLFNRSTSAISPGGPRSAAHAGACRPTPRMTSPALRGYPRIRSSGCAGSRRPIPRSRFSGRTTPCEMWWHAVYEGRRVASDTELRGLLDALESLFGEGTAP
jgi:hypothetical protein